MKDLILPIFQASAILVQASKRLLLVLLASSVNPEYSEFHSSEFTFVHAIICLPHWFWICHQLHKANSFLSPNCDYEDEILGPQCSSCLLLPLLPQYELLYLPLFVSPNPHSNYFIFIGSISNTEPTMHLEGLDYVIAWVLHWFLHSSPKGEPCEDVHNQGFQKS